MSQVSLAVTLRASQLVQKRLSPVLDRVPLYARFEPLLRYLLGHAVGELFEVEHAFVTLSGQLLDANGLVGGEAEGLGDF